MGDQRHLQQVLTVGAIIFWIGVMYYAWTQQMERALYGILFLGAALLIYIASELIDSLKEENWIDISLLSISGVITVIATVYIYRNFNELYLERVAWAYTHEYVLAAFFISMMTYLAWREFGKVFLFMIVGMIVYGHFGYLVPGALGHGGLTWTRILQISMLEISGTYGTLNRIVAAWVALFLLYAGLLQGYGAFDIIVRGALYTTKFVKSGVAQTAVVASAIIGSINGSRTANAAMTGSITIPMMKSTGISPETAAAIEADASSLGQILPPVMGSAGFLMAAMLGVTYAEIMVAATIPALILVITIGIAVHYTAIREVPDPEFDIDDLDQDIRTISRKQLPIELVRFGIPFVVLVYFLGVARYTVPTSALYTVFVMIGTGISIPVIQSIYTSSDYSQVVDDTKSVISNTIGGAKTGAVIMAPVALIVSAINIVVDLVLATGVPSALTLSLMALSGGIMALAAIIAMGIGVILGLGMPTVAAYIIVAILIAPTFVGTFNVPPEGAHFFALYAALLSGITPPVASAVAVTAGIAQANFLRACFRAVRLYAPMFVMPIVFLYHPEIVSFQLTLSGWSTGGIVLSGAIIMAYGLNHLTTVRKRYEWPIRGVYTGLGTMIMVYPNNFVQLGFLALAVIITLAYRSLVEESLQEEPLPSRS